MLHCHSVLRKAIESPYSKDTRIRHNNLTLSFEHDRIAKRNSSPNIVNMLMFHIGDDWPIVGRSINASEGLKDIIGIAFRICIAYSRKIGHQEYCQDMHSHISLNK